METEDRVRVFWDKCVENHTVASDSFSKNHFNASASRYYYALYQGFSALFEKRGIPVPDEMKRRDEYIKNPNPDSWPKRELAMQAIHELPDFKPNVNRLLYEIYDLRIISDYKTSSVEERELKRIQPDMTKLLAILNQKINGD